MNPHRPNPTRHRPAARMRAPTHALAAAEAVVLELLERIETTQQAAAATDEDDFSRCGWFDSSLELAAGLQVIEHVESLPDGLPLQPVH